MTQRPRAGNKGLNRPPLSLLQVLFVVGLAVGLLIMVDFNRRQAEAQRLEADRDRVATEVAALQFEHDALETQVAYATTDAAVIEWAHEQGKLVLTDEVLVVPLVPTPAPTAALAPPAPPPLPAPWTLWWALFFDIRPPVQS
ncbi:MAG: hypothetical protein IT318_17900 [Anaerolineales bacterium]|nr:hypothetical protein [Anaerolineales bacterium]